MQMQKMKGLKFGDIVINHYASEGNPQRTGVFVRDKNTSLEFTDMHGSFWSICNDSESKFEKIGDIFSKVMK